MAKFDKQHEPMLTEMLDEEGKPTHYEDEPTAPHQKMGKDQNAAEVVESIEPKRKKLAKGKGGTKNEPVAYEGPSQAPDKSIPHPSRKISK